MRIGFDAKRAFHNRTGLGNYSRFVIRSLAERHPGHEILAYTPNPRSAPFPDPFAELAGVRTAEPDTGLARRFPALWRTRLLSGQAVREGVDLFHGLSHELPQGLSRRGIPAVVTIHDMLPFLHPRLFPWTDRAVYRAKFTRACRTADLIVCVSRRTAADVSEILDIDPSLTRVVYQSCHEAFHQPASDEEVFRVRALHGLEGDYILSVGAVIERKNLLGLIRAVEILGPEAPLLAVAGTGGKYQENAAAYVRNAGLEERVRFLGMVDGKDLPALYRGAGVFAYPSFYEGFGIPILEALFSETPVVTSTGSCFKEAGGPDTLYADPARPEEIADALARVLENPGLAREMARKGALHARSFLPGPCADALMDVYAELT